ncbi:MAG: hypothetical protein J6C92_04815, partial [Bacteroidaceae bacterium]|nr:hypothetical protein [Bacteroidaceae bacterium]
FWRAVISNERSDVASRFRPHLFWREMEEVVGALKTKSCLSEASSFCLAETAEGIAKKVQPVPFLCFVSFGQAKEMKSPRGLSENSWKRNERPVRPEHKSLFKMK